MVHPSSSPSCNGSAAVHSSPTVSKALPSIISGASVQSQNNRSAGHHVQWSTPLVTRDIPAREFQGANPALATITLSGTSDHSFQAIAGAMEVLNLVPAAPSASTSLPASKPPQTLCHQPTSITQVAHQGSSSIAPPRNPNLRFIFERRLQAARARKLLNPLHSDIIDESPATTEPQDLMPVVSEVVHNQPNGTMESTTNIIGTAPPASNIMEDVIDLTLGSDEENSLLQKQPKNQKGSTQKQKNTQILSTSINVNTAKRPFDSESSDTSEDGPRKRPKRKGAPLRFNSGSATSDTDHVSPRSSVEPTSSSRFSTSSVEVTDVVVPSGPRSIADVYNNRAESSVSLDDTKPPKHLTQRSEVSVVVRTRERPGGSAVASSSRVTVEDMEESDAEVETVDPQRTRLYASAISRKVKMWAQKLKRIPRAHLDSLFDDNVEIMSKSEILQLLKDIDADKNWATRAEVEDARLERFLIAVVTEHLVNGTEAYRLAIRILDNFAQRFRGQRYPQTRR
ncbi:hypothetical protein EDB19DRAFT_1902166 [Suillus lakei]|nr:hypothetical protein EDB19DRAFT_1902166 [Suillus lakei]